MATGSTGLLAASALPWRAAPPGPRIRLRLSRGLRLTLLFAFALVLATIAGTKPIGTSPDDGNYRIMFEHASQTSLDELLASRDALFYVGAAFASRFGWDFVVFGTLWALASVGIKLAALAHLRLNAAILLLLYFSYLFWLHDVVQIRFGLALAMLLYAIYGRQRWLRAAMLVAAPLAHITVLATMLLYAAVRWPYRVALAAFVVAIAVVTQQPLQEALIGLAVASVDVYLELMALGQMDELNPLAVMPLLQTLILVAMLPRYAALPVEAQREFWLAVAGSIAFYALWTWPVFAFRFHEMFIVFFLILCARMWNVVPLLRPLVVAYALIGVRTTFFSQGSLLFPV